MFIGGAWTEGQGRITIPSKWCPMAPRAPTLPSLHYLGLVDQGGVRTDHGGAGLAFGPQGAVSLQVAGAVRLGHLGAVGLAVLVVGMLLTGGTAQTLVHFVLVVRHRRVAAAQRRLLVVLGDASRPRAAVRRHDGAAVQLPDDLGGLHQLEGRRQEGRVETGFLLGRHAPPVIWPVELAGWIAMLTPRDDKLVLMMPSTLRGMLSSVCNDTELRVRRVTGRRRKSNFLSNSLVDE
ncbi:hypothetical protein EYF80_052423 [Liparis tanakae]|uniref:Uncharacterized protein n=1 Tax=Liparis tanakae TaxID=230148 RepID=A0A4Z2F874_9TELE|nr:hypothetical protein EYF80_052423 [Liparis tanakae]